MNQIATKQDDKNMNVNDTESKVLACSRQLRAVKFTHRWSAVTSNKWLIPYTRDKMTFMARTSRQPANHAMNFTHRWNVVSLVTSQNKWQAMTTKGKYTEQNFSYGVLRISLARGVEILYLLYSAVHGEHWPAEHCGTLIINDNDDCESYSSITNGINLITPTWGPLDPRGGIIIHISAVKKRNNFNFFFIPQTFIPLYACMLWGNIFVGVEEKNTEKDI